MLARGGSGGAARRYRPARAFSHRQNARADTGRRRGGWPHRRDRGLFHRRRRGSRLSRHHPAQSGAVPRARARICLPRLWHLVHAECLERDVRRGRGRLDQGDRANRWHQHHGAKSRHRAGARFGAGPGTAVRSLGHRSPAGRDRPLSGRARFGSGPTVRRRTKSGRANGSALPAQPTVRCASTCGAMGSSAARGRSTDERSNSTG